jgi:uncharacterized protein YdhG (YjbR/CyaY superfamily)
MRNYSAKDVDEYIASMPEGARAKLAETRAVVKAAVPKADESISWGVPFYKYQGLLAGFAMGNGYVSFGLVFALRPEDAEELESKGYKTAKKTFRIRFDQKVPAPIIKRMLKSQAKMNELRKAAQ